MRASRHEQKQGSVVVAVWSKENSLLDLLRFPENTSSNDLKEKSRSDATGLQRSCAHTPEVSCIHFTAHSFYGIKRSTLSMLLFSFNRIWVSLSSPLWLAFLWMFILEATNVRGDDYERKRNGKSPTLMLKRFACTIKDLITFFLLFRYPGFFSSLIWWMHQQAGKSYVWVQFKRTF